MDPEDVEYLISKSNEILNPSLITREKLNNAVADFKKEPVGDPLNLYRLAYIFLPDVAIHYFPFYLYTDTEGASTKDLERIIDDILLPYYDDIVEGKIPACGFSTKILDAIQNEENPILRRIITRGSVVAKCFATDSMECINSLDEDLMGEVD